MSTRLFAFLLAGALMVPQTVVSADVRSDGFRLPPIPYAETIPWLTGSPPKAPSYIGLLLTPKPLTATPTDFAATPIPSNALFSTRLAGDTAIWME